MIRRLAIFDFDGTLVNTPTKPPHWKGGWWGRSHSLLPPHVPPHRELSEKGRHLVNEKVVAEYLKARQCGETHCAMMTGRHWGIRHEVMNILKAFDLATEEEHRNLKEEGPHFVFISGGNTLEGKIERINMFMEEFPDLEVCEMWEDRIEHIGEFRAHGEKLKQKYPKFQGIVVHEPPDWD